MSETTSKPSENPLQKIAVYVGGVLSVTAILGLVAMRDTLKRIEAQEPQREQIRVLEQEQIRFAIQLNSNEIDVMNMEMRDLEDRIQTLEARQ